MAEEHLIDMTDFIPCEFCLAAVGDPCRTASGGLARTHGARIYDWGTDDNERK